MTTYRPCLSGRRKRYWQESGLTSLRSGSFLVERSGFGARAEQRLAYPTNNRGWSWLFPVRAHGVLLVFAYRVGVEHRPFGVVGARLPLPRMRHLMFVGRHAPYSVRATAVVFRQRHEHDSACGGVDDLFPDAD